MDNRFNPPAVTPGQEFVGVVVGQGEADKAEDFIAASPIEVAHDCRL
jgi:threonine dehydrogenase-like Zn-dependent dehydrogenase